MSHTWGVWDREAWKDRAAQMEPESQNSSMTSPTAIMGGPSQPGGILDVPVL